MESAYDALMPTDEAASMLRTRVPRDEKPSVVAVLKGNNAKVNEWKKKVLDEISGPQRMIAASRVWESWMLFNDGHNTIEMQKLSELGMIPRPNEEIVMFWKDLFENLPVEDLHQYGTAVIAIGWGIIQNHIHMWLSDKKYEMLFGESDDPLYWEKNYHNCSSYLRSEILPFWDKETFAEIRNKVSAVLNIQVRVQ